MEVAGAGFSSSWGWASPKENCGHTVLRSPGEVEDAPLLGLTQGELDEGRHLGSQDLADSKGGRASSSPIGIPSP